MPGPFRYQALDPSLQPPAPPAPVFYATISWGTKSESIRALIDSGAGETYIPITIAQRLRLRKTGDEVIVSGAAGKDETQYVYVANLNLQGILIPNHPMISNSKRNYAIIGRDILNRYATLLNGPSLELSIT